MNRFLIGLLLISFLVSANVEVKEVGRYQLAVSTYASKKGTVYVVETVLDTKTGKIINRKKIRASKYKLPYKDNRGRMITSD
jgi:hypothetical protein